MKLLLATIWILIGAALTSGHQLDDSQFVEIMIMGNGLTAIYDHSFYNIGVRPTVEDLGVGETITLVDSDNPDRTLTYPK
jgi:hypothetical protein